MAATLVRAYGAAQDRTMGYVRRTRRMGLDYGLHRMEYWTAQDRMIGVAGLSRKTGLLGKVVYKRPHSLSVSLLSSRNVLYLTLNM